jgi:hypothetical protein
MGEKEFCVVLLCNNNYFTPMINTLTELRQSGYNGDICLVIGDDLKDSDKLTHPSLKNVVIKHFPDIEFTQGFLDKFNSIKRDQYWRDKKFQYHKLHLFNKYFKEWEYILYIDSGVRIFRNIQPIINVRKKNTLLAHSDAYHTYEWRLSNQFDKNDDLFDVINNKFNLNVDYPQSTIMLYDTNIIEDETYNDLLSLTEEVKISITNDQGMIALYFTNVKPHWEQIPLGDDRTWFYDYLPRSFKMNKPHIMLKRF